MSKRLILKKTTTEVANDNEAKEPKHVITAEISIEVTGEDEPTKYDKRRERWAVICFWALDRKSVV